MKPGYYLRPTQPDHVKAVNGDHVPVHGCEAGAADPSCCALCGLPVRNALRTAQIVTQQIDPKPRK